MPGISIDPDLPLTKPRIWCSVPGEGWVDGTMARFLLSNTQKACQDSRLRETAFSGACSDSRHSLDKGGTQ